MSSPVGKTSLARCWPYGGSTAVNVLPQYLGTPDIVTHVLFLSSGDLRNALVTIAKMTDAYPQLDIHLADDNNYIVARNILLANIMLSDNFNPSEIDDMDYLWSLWYSEWTDSTRLRFIEDLKKLFKQQWGQANENQHSIILDKDACQSLNSVLRSWLLSATKEEELIPDSFYPSIIRVYDMVKEENQEFFAKRPPWHVANNNPFHRGLQTLGQHVKNLACIISRRLRINLPNYSSSSMNGEATIQKEIEDSLWCIDSQSVLNPTLNGKRGRFMGDYRCSPLDAYFPIPFDDQLLEGNLPHSATAFPYCKSKLQFLVTKLRLKKERIVFRFHFTSDCIELCMQNEKLQNKFQVIHCSFLLDKVGLSNLLPAVAGCLIQDDPTAVLLAESTQWVKFGKPTVAEYVEMALGCPLSMVPTLYGSRLANHSLLGSPVCVNLHDSTSTNPITLKLLKAPAYSSNVPLAVSPALKSALDQLAQFIQLRWWSLPLTSDDNHFIRALVTRCLPYTPLTSLYVLQSMKKRCQWVPGSIESLFQSKAIPTHLQLAWRTQRDWISGQPVLLFSTKNSSFFQTLRRDNYAADPFGMGLHPIFAQRLLKQPMSDDGGSGGSLFLVLNSQNISLQTNAHGNFDSRLLENAQCIDYLGFSKRAMQFIQVSPPQLEDPIDHTVSFLLPIDHGFAPDTFLCHHNATQGTLKSCSFFDNFESTIVINANPSLTPPSIAPPQSIAADIGLRVISCLESEDDYQLEIAVRGLPIGSINELIVSLEDPELHAQNALFSSHQITLTLGSAEPLTIRLPWPFLVDKIFSSLRKSKKKKRIQLWLKKSVKDAFPGDFGGRSKWDVDLFTKPWRDVATNGDLKKHLEAQFSCDNLHSNLPSNSFTSLTNVRRIVQHIFLSHCDHPFSFLFAIHDRDATAPTFHLRVQPPIRFTPQGSPLLVVSVIDYQFANQLIDHGKLDRETLQSDFHRLITQGVSREMCVIRTSSSEETDLFRYSLRLNSTKMRRCAWQSKNLPRGEFSPWLPTFISPLYAENISIKWNCAESSLALSQCSGCGLKPTASSGSTSDVRLRQCSRCKSASYCSITCQRNHWPLHRVFCF